MAGRRQIEGVAGRRQMEGAAGRRRIEGVAGRRRIEGAAVVVPARDEEETIAVSLGALRRATRAVTAAGVPVHVVVVLDRCSDTTGDRAEAALAGSWSTILEVKGGNVGLARSAGMQAALSAWDGVDLRALWLATTDADTLVRPDWLARHLAWARAGYQGVAGTVEVGHWGEQPEAVRRQFLHRARQLGLGLGHPHVHGANLGLLAEAYLEAGGVPALALAEDARLLQAVVATGRPVVAAPDIPVVTSSRREGRAPGGFADLLRGLGRAPA